MQSSPSSSHAPGPVSRRRLCLFGGSFDPVHLGHTGGARQALQSCRLEKIVFLPAWQSPHKAGQRPAPSVHRLAMLRLALVGLPWADVSTWEIDRGGPSYSWQTAEHFAGEAGPEVDLWWLLGADQWDRLETWARPDLLAARLTFIVFPRGDTPVAARDGFRHVVLSHVHPASSTAVRDAVRNHRPLDGLVAPAVAEYIRDHGLYRGDAAS